MEDIFIFLSFNSLNHINFNFNKIFLYQSPIQFIIRFYRWEKESYISIDDRPFCYEKSKS